MSSYTNILYVCGPVEMWDAQCSARYLKASFDICVRGYIIHGKSDWASGHVTPIDASLSIAQTLNMAAVFPYMYPPNYSVLQVPTVDHTLNHSVSGYGILSNCSASVQVGSRWFFLRPLVSSISKDLEAASGCDWSESHPLWIFSSTGLWRPGHRKMFSSRNRLEAEYQ